MKKKYLILDFDSTFVQVETLDELASIALDGLPAKRVVLEKIRELTQDAMSGKISFPEALQKRIALIQANRIHVDTLVENLHKLISPSIARHQQFFREYAESVFILSGGFFEIVWPIVSRFGIPRENVFANRFLYDFEGSIIGYDARNPLAHDQGKVKVVESLDLQGSTILLGDGFTDYEVKKEGKVDTFVAFTENIERPEIVAVADKVVSDFGSFLVENGWITTPSVGTIQKRVLLLENIHPDALNAFEKQGFSTERLTKGLSEKELIEKLQGVSVLGVRSKTQVTRKVIESVDSLEVVGAFCIGTNQIDLVACEERGIPVFNAPYSNTRSVVELAIGEIIMLLRKIFEKSEKMHRGQWDKSPAGAVEVRGKSLGIIGYGNIGSQLSTLAEAMGMKVRYYDVAEKLPLGNAEKCETLDQLLELSEVVSIHVDGNLKNKNYFGEREFAVMREGSLLINLSRGFVVNIGALKKNLESGKIMGAAVDVFPQEPDGTKADFVNELQGVPNVILTPHIGGNTAEAQQNIGDFVSQTLAEYMKLGSTLFSVNFPNLKLPEIQETHRLIHIHRNVPGVVANVSAILAKYKLNIEEQYLKTSERIGYVITDVNAAYDGQLLEDLKEVPDTIQVRLLY
jgi:D-3-phosphoglycerate dehydrogenase